MWGESGRERLLGIQPEKRCGGSTLREPCWQGEGRHRREGLKGWLGGRAESRHAHFKPQGAGLDHPVACRPGKLTAGETWLREIQGPLGPHPRCPRQLKLNRSKQKSHSGPELAIPSSGNPYLCDPDAHRPPIKAGKWEPLETHLSHPALDLQTWLY